MTRHEVAGVTVAPEIRELYDAAERGDPLTPILLTLEPNGWAVNGQIVPYPVYRAFSELHQ